MSRPVMRVEGIIRRVALTPAGERVTHVLVQCDREESFYRFPGGSVEFGETAAMAIVREFAEEFDLPVQVGNLAVVAENLLHFEGRDYHQCTLLHGCTLADADVRASYKHKEHSDIQVIWRTLDELQKRPVYPTGILDYLLSGETAVCHLVENQLNSMPK